MDFTTFMAMDFAANYSPVDTDNQTQAAARFNLYVVWQKYDYCRDQINNHLATKLSMLDAACYTPEELLKYAVREFNIAFNRY